VGRYPGGAMAAGYARRVAVSITRQQALAWRMQRHLLDPVGALPVTRVVGRLCGVQAQVASSAELAVRVRRQRSRSGEVSRALSQGRLIKTWAMRGALHLLTPEEAGAFLSLMATGRSWERPSWQRYFGVTTKQLETLRHAVREALDGRRLTREELVAAVVQRRGLKHVGEALLSGWGTLLKPLAWQGELCHGPSQGNRVTFMRPADASSRWAGVPDPDQAAPVAIAAYLGAHGPATIDAFGNWLAGGWFGKRQLRTWFEALEDRLAEVDVEGERAHVLAEDLDELGSTAPTNAVRLLPGFDQYVLGPGTADARVVPTARRSAVSRQAGWISPVVISGGVVCGTWERDGDRVGVAWFSEAGRAPRKGLEAEVRRLSSILGHDLQAAITRA
jgi:Winged helix DNA-binding domain